VLVAIASAGDVGVDVEVLGRDITDWELVEQALTKGERDRLQALPDGERTESFLRSWTRKEAILKAAGTGLGIDPRLVELDELEIVAVPAELGSAREWTLIEVPIPDHTATVALKGRLAGVHLYDARS
jgi:4'-phosphopantetheinyl transferase